MTPEEQADILSALAEHPDKYIWELIHTFHVQDPAPDRAGLERQLVPILALDERLQTLEQLIHNHPLVAVALEEGDRERYGWIRDVGRRTGILTLVSLEPDDEEFKVLFTFDTQIRFCRPPWHRGVPDLDLS